VLADALAAGKGGPDATTISLAKEQAQITTFMQTNRDYISNQADVINSYAQLIRSGLDQTQTQRVMNDALDLAALKGISLTDAVTALSNAEFGRMRGLIDLGITTAKYTDANGNLVQSQHSVAQAMAEVDAKVKAGRDSLTPLQKATNDLSGDWSDLALRVGPPLLDFLDGAAKGLDAVLVAGQGASNDPFWSSLDQKLSDSAGALRRWWLSKSAAGLAQLAKEDAATTAAADNKANLAYKGPSAGPGQYEAAAAQQALMDKTGQGNGPSVSTIGSTLVPPIVAGQLAAKLQAMDDATKLQAKLDQVVAHLGKMAQTVPQVSVSVTIPPSGNATVQKVIRQITAL